MKPVSTLVLCAALFSPVAAPAADPFYENLLAEGAAAHARSDLETAVRHLRLACFGLLEEPPKLAECLTRLAIAQAAAGDGEGFLASFDRLLEIERRFGAYSSARFEPFLRHQLEAAAEERLEADRLARHAVFRPLYLRLLEKRLAALPANERRLELEGLIERDGADGRWRLMLSRLELEAERPAAALAALAPVVAREPGNAEALCLRGLARAELAACAEAVGDLASCGPPVARPALAAAVLGCRVALGRYREAEALLAELGAELQREQPFKRLAREVRRGLRNAPPAAAVEADGEAGAEAVAGAGEAAPKSAEPTEALAEVRERLDELAASLQGGASNVELAETFVEARALADAHPELARAQHLAAELAYRTARWQQAVDYFARGGEIPSSRPDLSFYLAVALYELGETERAATTLRACQDRLQQTDFVRSYAQRILGEGG